MFSKIFKIAVVVSTLAASALAAPSSISRLPTQGHGSISFDRWGGFDSLAGFDNFYGSDNFSGHSRNQVFVQQEQELVCHSESIEIIQQRLLVIQELAKRIITEQICEVETQTIAFEQFYASTGLFSQDLRRNSGRQVGYDSEIASHFGDIFEDDGSLSNEDFGFSGHDLGEHTVVIHGSNWDDSRSRESVGSAYSAARNAFYNSYFSFA